MEHVQKPTDYVVRDANERLVTSIRIQKGATVCIRADGKINFGGLFGPGEHDPDGEDAPAPSDFRAPGLRKFSLACGIQPFQANAVSRWYQCGTAKTFTADQEGWLVLLQNDSAVRDNRGQWTVRSLVVTQPYWTGFAPAQTPILDAVLVIPAPGGSFTQVWPGTNDRWNEILPIGSPSGGVRLQLHTPFPASLKVEIDGTDLAKDQSPGYSPNITNDASTTGVARWAVNVVPPPGKNTGSQYEIGVKSSVGNQTSDRLVIKLVKKPQPPPAPSAQGSNCPAPVSIQGYRYAPEAPMSCELLAAGSQGRGGQPLCDAKGWYCCGGLNKDPNRCPSENSFWYPPKCGNEASSATRMELKQPYGCYEKLGSKPGW